MKHDTNPLYEDKMPGIEMKPDPHAPGILGAPPPPAPPPPPKGFQGIYPPQAEEESEYTCSEEEEVGDWMDEADVPEACSSCIHFKAIRESEGEEQNCAVLLAADLPAGTVHEAYQSGEVAQIPFRDFTSLTRSTSDATRLGYEVDEEGTMLWYSLPDPESRQLLYQALLTGNPFGVEGSGSIDERNITVYSLKIECAQSSHEDCSVDGLGEGADVICVMVVGDEGRDEWVDTLQNTLMDDYVFHDGLYADADEIGHCLTVFISHELSDILSNAQSGVAEDSTGVTFWLGETTFGIYGAEGDTYEDVGIGAPGLDLNQFRHLVGIGNSINDVVQFPALETQKKSCGSDSCFLWRSQPDGYEGHASKTSGGSSDLGEFAMLSANIVVPQLKFKGPGESCYMLVVDNLRASGLAFEGNPYVHIGGQFCDDRRTSSKQGTTNPVWKFDRQIGGQNQTTHDMLQIPTYVQDIDYLGAQRVMIGVLDEATPDDPLIGFSFLPLAKACESENSALDFAVELFNGIDQTGTLSGRISVHSMQSTMGASVSTPKSKKKKGNSESTEKVKSPDSGNNRKIIQQYFKRYDLDESGTINSSEELQQLCTNLSVRMELPFSVSDIDNKVSTAGDMDVNNWDIDEFIKWFSQEFDIDVA